MRKFYLILIVLLNLWTLTPLKAQQFDWVKTIGNGSYLGTNDIAEDNEGNVYITGYFSDTLDFDPGVNEYLLISPPDIYSTFILKLDAEGNFIWAKTIEKATGFSVITGDSGNVYICGYFEAGTIDLDPGPGVFDITSSWTSNTFLLKLNSTGEFIWAKVLTRYQPSYNSSPFALDKFENLYLTGDYIGNLTLLPENSNIAPYSEHTNSFILKFNNQGSVQWLKNFEGDFNVGLSIHVDEKLNVYTSGYFADTIDFDPGIEDYKLIDTNIISHYINKLDSSGNFAWVNTFSGDYNDLVITLENDTSGNIYAGGGMYSDSIDFNLNNGGDVHINNGSGDCFIIKYDKNGNYNWTKTFGGTGPDKLYRIGVNQQGSIFLAGVYSGNVDFDLSDGIREKQSYGTYGVFFLVTDSSGRFKSVNTIEGNYLGTDWGLDAFITEESSLLIANEFQGTAYFDPSNEEYIVNGESPKDLFFTKWNLSCLQSSATIDTLVCDSEATIDSNFYDESGTYYYTIPNNQGCDSLIQLNLTLYPVNKTITITNDKLIANEIDCEFQWLDCKNNLSIIEGATSNEFTPSSSGDYAVQIKKEECLVTSSCYSYSITGILNNSFNNSIKVYPNPTEKSLTIRIADSYEKVNVRIYYSNGTYLNNLEFQKGEEISFDLGEKQGYYFIEVKSGKQSALIKALKL